MTAHTKTSIVGTAATNGSEAFVSGTSSAMRTLLGVLAELASTNIPILLAGESGTGKQVIARRLHEMSPRHAAPFIKISCASATPETFGVELGLNGNGAAPHAMSGSVFFDEIGDLHPECQKLLLCALPDDDAAGRSGTLTMRVISTTNRNLDEAVRAGIFRSELYYRINGVCLRVPPLRERKDDIPELVEFFLTKYAARLGRPRPIVTSPTLKNFMNHSWPGNVRELENVLKKVVALGDEQFALNENVETAAVVAATEAQARSLKAAARAASREAERGLILKTLARTRWNRKRAAQELQISYKSLLYKLKQIGLDDTNAT